MLTSLFSAVAALVAMELYSAVVHRVLWHGPLRRFHASHHAKPNSAELGPNDLLSFSHVPVSMAFVLAGFLVDGRAGAVMLGVGVGLTVYGVLYFVFHDGMVHGRLPLAGLLRRSALCRAWQAAHAVHHRSARGPYGFFASPLVLLLASLTNPTKRH